jgi:predicted enzyme related to lactoylglutathione lyase
MRLPYPDKELLKLFLVIFLILPLAKSISQPITRPALIGVASAEFMVSDINKAKSFYQGLLGYTCRPLQPDANKRQSFHIQVNQRQTIRIQDGLPAAQDERLISIGFQTTDVEAMRLYLKSKGITVPDKVTREGETSLSFSVFDPDRHEVKFIQLNSAVKQKSRNNDAELVSDRILHVGLTISDVNQANSFYQDILGFSEIWRGGVGTTTDWINMRLPESTDYLEYMLITAPPARQVLGAHHHVALLTHDMQKAIDLLRPRADKIHFEMPAPRIGRNNRWQLNLYDPDGTRIELMEPFPMRPTQ